MSALASADGTPSGTPQPPTYAERVSIAALDKPWKNPNYKPKSGTARSKTLKQVLLIERDRTLPFEERLKRKKKKAAGKGIRAAEAEAAAIAEEEAAELDASGPTVTCACALCPSCPRGELARRLHHRGAPLDEAGQAVLRHHRVRGARPPPRAQALADARSQAPYTDPKSNLRYHNAEIYALLRTFVRRRVTGDSRS
jgi:INO80 complex subunit C